jgi:Domain of unknown function (DUF222)
MTSTAFHEAIAAYDALVTAAAQCAAIDRECFTEQQQLALLERGETVRRMQPALDHESIIQLSEYSSVEELGGTPARVLADRLRITPSEARRRLDEAADLASRRAFSGELLSPKLEATAAGQREGAIGTEHVRVIRSFFAHLPCWIDEPTRADAERKLAEVASRYRPDELKRFAAHLDLILNPDGNFSDEDRARRRGITVGPQGPDGMSRLTGWLNPELRAGMDAVLAKWAAPGVCNPADEDPTVTGDPSDQAINADTRTTAQRIHDALTAMVRSILMSGELGSHQGLPVTIVATVSLEDLQNKAGMAHTGGGTLLPTTDLIRMAAHAYNYLLVFDSAKKCELYKGRDTRLATPAQRLVLYATERGCTHPGCYIPAYWCQVHHAQKDWARGGQTNIDEETLACGPHNRLVDEHAWTTRKRKDGTTEWIPPPHLDRGQRRTNTYFHPEKMADDPEHDPEDHPEDDP